MLNAPIPLLLTATLIAALSVNIVRKKYIGRVGSSLTSVFIFCASGTLVSALTLFLWDGFGSVSLFTVLLAIGFGVTTVVQTLCNLSALATGLMSYTVILVSFSTIIPTMSGPLFFGEPISIMHYIGISLMLISFVLVTKKEKDTSKFSLRWLFLAVSASLTTGAIGVMQKIHQKSVYKAELTEFLIISFCVSSVLAITFSLLCERKMGFEKKFSGVRKNIAWIIVFALTVNGIGVALNNKLNLFLAGAIPSAIFFPLVNGGGLVLSTLAAVLIFKERLPLRGWVGVSLGILSVVCVCNPFGI